MSHCLLCKMTLPVGSIKLYIKGDKIYADEMSNCNERRRPYNIIHDVSTRSFVYELYYNLDWIVF